MFPPRFKPGDGDEQSEKTVRELYCFCPATWRLQTVLRGTVEGHDHGNSLLFLINRNLDLWTGRFTLSLVYYHRQKA
jgi:hypothetical protein